MTWEVYRYFDYGWIKRYYIDPQFFFTYYGFDWIQPWPGDGMYWHFYLMGALAICIAIGFAYRLVMPLFFLAFTYVFLLDQTNYLNHFYLISLISLLLCFVPAHRAFSIDARLHPSIRSKVAPAWAVYLIPAQIAIVYIFGGIAKLNGDWLQGEPMRIWLSERTDFPIIGRWFTEEWMVYLFSYGGLFIDLFVVPLILWRRTRWFAVTILLSFHLLNMQLFSIGIFPWFMIATTPLFFPPHWFERIAYFRRPEVLPTFRVSRVIFAGLALYFAVQIALPLRHFFYPGDVNWTEEGHTFAWHMKLRDKAGEANFTVYDPVSDRTWAIDRSEFLTRRQSREISGHPDMILLFAHYLADLWHSNGFPQAEVYVEAQISLNGRAPQWMIDPNVDLAQVSRDLAPAAWILPLYEPLNRDTIIVDQ
jgi:hypothetical protein